MTDPKRLYYSTRAYGYSLMADAHRVLARAERLDPYGDIDTRAVEHHEEMAADMARWSSYWDYRAEGLSCEEAEERAGLESLMADRPSHETAAPEFDASAGPGTSPDPIPAAQR